MSKIIKSLSALTVGTFLLSGCASMLVNEISESSSKDVTLFKDEFVAIGKPSQPITGFNNVLILASPKNSLIVELEDKDYGLFNQLVPQLQSGKINNQHLSLSSIGESGGTNQKGMKLDKAQQIYKIRELFVLYYRENNIEKDSRRQKELTNMGFECKYEPEFIPTAPKLYPIPSELYCRYELNTKITLANAVNNSHSLTHQFKHPYEYRIYYTKNNNALKATGIILTPVAFAVDLVTLPIHAITGGLFIPRLPDR